MYIKHHHFEIIEILSSNFEWDIWINLNMDKSLIVKGMSISKSYLDVESFILANMDVYLIWCILFVVVYINFDGLPCTCSVFVTMIREICWLNNDRIALKNYIRCLTFVYCNPFLAFIALSYMFSILCRFGKMIKMQTLFFLEFLFV